MDSDEDRSDHNEKFDVLILHGDVQAELAETVCRNIQSIANGSGICIRVTTLGGINRPGMQESDIFDYAIESSTFILFFRCKTFLGDNLHSFAVSAALYDRLKDKNTKRNYTLIPLDIEKRTKIRGKPLINGLHGIIISASGEIPKPQKIEEIIRKCRTTSQRLSESLIRQQIAEAETRQSTEISSLVNSTLDLKRESCSSQEKLVSEDNTQASTTCTPPLSQERHNEKSGQAVRKGTETSSPPNGFRENMSLTNSVEVDYPVNRSLLGSCADLPTPRGSEEQRVRFPSPDSYYGLSRGYQPEAQHLLPQTHHDLMDNWNKKGARPKTFNRRQETGVPLQHAEERHERCDGLQSGTLLTGDVGLVPAGHGASQEELCDLLSAEDKDLGDAVSKMTECSLSLTPPPPEDPSENVLEKISQQQQGQQQLQRRRQREHLQQQQQQQLLQQQQRHLQQQQEHQNNPHHFFFQHQHQNHPNPSFFQQRLPTCAFFQQPHPNHPTPGLFQQHHHDHRQLDHTQHLQQHDQHCVGVEQCSREAFSEITDECRPAITTLSEDSGKGCTN